MRDVSCLVACLAWSMIKRRKVVGSRQVSLGFWKFTGVMQRVSDGEKEVIEFRRARIWLFFHEIGNCVKGKY